MTNADYEYLQLLKRAHDLGIIAINDIVINPDILLDSINHTRKIDATPAPQNLPAPLPPTKPTNTLTPAPQPKLSRCVIQPDLSLLRDVVETLEKNPLDFKAIAKEMEYYRQHPEMQK